MNKRALIPFVIILGMFIFTSCSGKGDGEESTENQANSKEKKIPKPAVHIYICIQY